MIILIAGDDTVNQALANHLAGNAGHRIYTVADMGGLEEAAVTLQELDVLLFTAAYSRGRGKELRDAMRGRFPGLQTVLISGEGGGIVPAETIVGWLAAFEQRSAGAAGPVLLGDYELIEKCRPTETTDTFRAVQRSVNREVTLERLRPELLKNKTTVKEFRELVKARAAVSCPWIATVYEAKETDGVIYYTREVIQGRSLDELVAARARLTPEDCLHLLSAAGEAMVWLAERKVAREPLGRQHLVMGQDGAPRVANIARAKPLPLDEPAEICAVAESLMRVADFQLGHARELSHVLGLMKAKGPHALTSWKAVLREARTALHRVAGARTSSRAEGRKTQRLPQRRGRGPRAVAGLMALAAACAGLVWWKRLQDDPARPPFKSSLIKIPAGEFIFRDGQKLTLPDFWMDSHEVTIGQYARFLAAVAGGTQYDHPDQPGEKRGHEPADWAVLYSAAQSGGHWKGYPVSLECPVFNVDWWDAWACAKWMGRRLPTEKEWEKAARGTNGRNWPWGMEPDPKRANTGADYAEHPGPGKGAADGFVWWCEVNAMPQDVSVFQIYGMAGNVSEWTATWLPDPGDPDKQAPVFRGGDFHRNSPAAMTTSWLAKSPDHAQPFLGFRTVSDAAPADD